MLTHPTDARKQHQHQDEQDRLKAIAALQSIIVEALANKLDHDSFVASVANWVARACDVKAQR